MFWSRWTRTARPATDAGRALYAEAAAQARAPAFYAALGVPDTANGRFEIYSLHVILLLHRLKRRGEASAERGSLAAVLAECAGKWVAVDRATNEARLMADSPYELAAEIRRLGLRNVAVVRAPDPSEPELVGLG